jgi:hypothetical protein
VLCRCYVALPDDAAAEKAALLEALGAEVRERERERERERMCCGSWWPPCESDEIGVRVRDELPRRRFVTPADFPRHDCSPYSHVHARRESLGVVPRSRAIYDAYRTYL